MRIKSWEKFQHYKTRKPPWIKLYHDIIDDLEWHKLSGDASKLLVMLWLLASESDGSLPSVEKISWRLRIPVDDIKLTLSTLFHWIEGIDSDTLAERKQDAMPEKRREETDKEKRKNKNPDSKNESGPKKPFKDNRVLESLCDAFKKKQEAKLGEPPNFNIGAARAGFRKLLKSFPGAEIFQRMDYWFKQEDGFYGRRSWRVEDFVSNFNGLKEPEKKKEFVI